MESFESLYREMLPVVYKYASARLGKDDGEDVTSEVFHAAADRLRKGEEDVVTPAWLMAVAKNKVIDRWRKAERRGALSHLVEPRAEDLVADSAEAMTSQLWATVIEALDRLPVNQRTLLVLRYVDDLSLEQLAVEAGISETAAESALARARRALRGVMETA